MRKNRLCKSIMAAVLSLAMVMSSTSFVMAADTGEKVGNEDDTGTSISGKGELTVKTDPESLSGDFDITYTGHEVGGTYSHAPMLEFRDTANNCIDLRFDNYGWVWNAADSSIHYISDAESEDYVKQGIIGKEITLFPKAGWDGIAEERAKGMDFEANVKRTGNVFKATFTESTADGPYVIWTYTINWDVIGSDLTVLLSFGGDDKNPEQVTLTNIKFKNNKSTEGGDTAVTGITLDKTTAELKVGESVDLKATVAPADATDKSCTWKSSDEKIATVKDGKVTAVAVGTATITVTTNNGNKTASCAVTVKAASTTDPTTVSVTGITLDKTTAELKVGETTDLKATVAPENATDKSYTWKSSDDNIATVNDGKVTAVAAGTATITVTTTDGNKTATCAVTVKAATTTDPTTVSVTGVTLDKTTAELKVGESVDLKATVAPADATDKSYTWKSSDDKIATVKDGKVTAVAAGTATITVTTTDGNKTATCAVTVKAATTTDPTTVSVTGITLDKTTAELKVGESVDLKATVAPENATDKSYTWKSSDEKIATVKDGKVTAVAAGTATITATTKDGNKTASCTVTVKAADTGNIGDPGTTVLKKTTITVKKGKKKVSSVSVKKGKKATLKVTTSSKAKLSLGKLSKKNKKIASVTLKKGKLTIKGKKKGTVKITITSAKTKTYKKATKKITIKVK